MAGGAISAIKDVLRQNFRKLLDRDFPLDKYPKGRGQIGALINGNRGFKRHELSKLQRAKADGRCNLDTVQQIAAAFRLQPYQLFIKDLNVDDPQEAVNGKQLRLLKQIKEEK